MRLILMFVLSLLVAPMASATALSCVDLFKSEDPRSAQVTVLRQKRNYEAAFVLNEQILSSHPSAAVMIRKVTLLLDLQRVEDALRAAQAAVLIYSRSTEAYVALARVHVQRRHFQEALDIAFEAGKADSKNPVPYFLKAEILLAMGRASDALTAYQQAEKQFPTASRLTLYNDINFALKKYSAIFEPQVYLAKKATEMIAQGKFAEVQAFVVELFNQKGRDPEVIALRDKVMVQIKLNKFKLLMAERQYKEALELVNDALKDFPGEENLMIAQLRAMNRLGEYENALRVWKDYSQQFATLSTNAMGLATYTLMGLHRYHEALGLSYQLVEMAPTARNYDLRGEILTQLGDYKSALDNFALGLKIDPINQDILLHRSYTFYRSGQFAEAVADAKRARPVEFRDAVLAISYMRMGRVDLVGELLPNLRTVRLGLWAAAEFHFRQSHMEKAAELLEKIIVMSGGKQLSAMAALVSIEALGNPQNRPYLDSLRLILTSGQYRAVVSESISLNWELAAQKETDTAIYPSLNNPFWNGTNSNAVNGWTRKSTF